VLSPAIKTQLPVVLNPSLDMNQMITSISPMTHQETPLVNTSVEVHQYAHNRPSRCDRCSGIWCTYLECIIRASLSREDDQKQNQLQSSYDDLRHHIQEHLRNSYTTCSLCEDLFFHHMLQRQLLFSVHSAEAGEIRLAMGTNLMYLRKHVEEVH